MSYRITVAPAAEILTTAEAKTSTRIDHSTEDTLIDEYVASARLWIERQYDLALVDQTVVETFNAFPESGELRLTVRPVMATSDIASLKYYDEDNALQTFSSANYVVTLEGDEAVISLGSDASWPTIYDRPGAIEVTYTAGFGAAASDVPLALKSRVRQAVWDLYEFRGVMPDKLVPKYDMLLNPWTRKRV